MPNFLVLIYTSWRGIDTPEPEVESALPFAQLWDEEEEEEDMTNFPMMGAREPTTAEDPSDNGRHLQGSPLGGIAGRCGFPRTTKGEGVEAGATVAKKRCCRQRARGGDVGQGGPP